MVHELVPSCVDVYILTQEINRKFTQGKVCIVFHPNKYTYFKYLLVGGTRSYKYGKLRFHSSDYLNLPIIPIKSYFLNMTNPTKEELDYINMTHPNISLEYVNTYSKDIKNIGESLYWDNVIKFLFR
jgi:hypothetical protein